MKQYTKEVLQTISRNDFLKELPKEIRTHVKEHYTNPKQTVWDFFQTEMGMVAFSECARVLLIPEVIHGMLLICPKAEGTFYIKENDVKVHLGLGSNTKIIITGNNCQVKVYHNAKAEIESFNIDLIFTYACADVRIVSGDVRLIEAYESSIVDASSLNVCVKKVINNNSTVKLKDGSNTVVFRNRFKEYI